MADSAVVITSGTGTNIDTRTESTNGNHRQVVTIGDPSTNAGVAPVDATAGLKVDLGADNDVTVTGTVTAELSATDNAVLDNIDADLTTIIGHVDGAEGLLTTIDADTSNISTKIDTIAGDTTSIQTAVELLDDTVATDGSATPTKGILMAGQDGTNAQTVKTDSDGNLQVDVLTMPSVAVTNAGITTIAGAVSGTEMQVDIVSAPTLTVNAHAVTNAGTFAVQVDGAALTSLQLIDDAIYTDGTGTVTKGVAILGQDGTNPQAIKTDAAGELQVDVLTMPTTTVTGTVTAELSATDNAVLDTIDAVLDTINAKLVTGTDIGDVTINNAAGASAVNIQDGGNSITVDGTVAVTNSDITSIKTAVEILDNAISGNEMQVDMASSLPAGTNNIGDVDVLTLPSSVQGPGNPAVDSYTHAAINLAAGANQVLVSSAANKQIWVYGIGFTVNVAGTVSFQDEDDTALTGVMNMVAGGGMAAHPSGNFSMPMWKLATNKDLEVDIVTSELDGWVNYAIISV